MTQEGKISVEVVSDSMFFGYHVPVEVRDSQLRLVTRSTSERQFPLQSGLYEVSAVLEDGRRYQQLVQVHDGQTVYVTFGSIENNQAPERALEAASPEIPVYHRPRYIQKMDAISDLGNESTTGVTTQLLEVTGASLLRESRLLWVFGSQTKLDAVPTALIQYGDRKFRISLPISPEHGFPENSCVVKVEETRLGVHVNAWIAKERTVANALQNILASGYLIDAADVASNALELLRDKYSDPTGAALGALILYKVGRLETWMSWMENLARDFDWLPDGKVLLARLLYNNETDRERALELAMKASSQRMLYGECYSLLLDMLRRWPRSIDRDNRRQAIDRLITQAADVDWDSICLSQVIQEEP